MVTQNDLIKVMEKEPSLTCYGLNSLYNDNLPKEMSLAEREKEVKKQREYFSARTKEFEICCKWLSKFKHIKTPQISSYYLKHVVEKLEGKGAYISNGSLIAAAIHLGIPIKTSPEYPNPDIAISKKCPFLKNIGNIG